MPSCDGDGDGHCQRAAVSVETNTLIIKSSVVDSQCNVGVVKFQLGKQDIIQREGEQAYAWM